METKSAIALSRMPQLTNAQRYERLETCRTAEATLAAVCPSAAERTRLLADAAEVQQRAAKCGYVAVPFTSEAYPPLLRGINSAPMVLYVRGTVPQNLQHVLSVVGTRKASPAGKEMTRRFVKEVAALVPDVVVVSGLAYGIDIAAHLAALEAGVPTIAVMATGPETVYPAAHRGYAERIVQSGGALITEQAPGAVANGRSFLARNRIIAALSHGTLVVECGLRSGARSTAAHALESGREVMAVPGRPGDVLAEGTNELIRRCSAALVTSGVHVCETLGWNTEPIQPRADEPSLFAPAVRTPQQQQVLNLLEGKASLHVNEIAAALGQPLPQVQGMLFEMVVEEILYEPQPGRFARA